MHPDSFDIYISYAREDAESVRRIVQELESVGLQVWVDDQPLSSRESMEMLRETLDETKVHVVIWSNESAASGRVQAEARLGSEKGRLVAARIDNLLPPRGTRAVTYADLSDWEGGQDHRGMKKLLYGIYHLIGKGVKPVIPPPETRDRFAPQGTHAARDKDERAWKICLARDTRTYYIHYLNHFPNGRYVQEARRRIELKQRNGRLLLTCAIIWIVAQVIVTIAVQTS